MVQMPFFFFVKANVFQVVFIK